MVADAAKLVIKNPKRGKRPTGREAWFPYYAGFSGEFASALLSSASLGEGRSVLDPWNGSGTTTATAAELGCSSIGLDLNPVMVIVAKARALPKSEKSSLVPLLADIVKKARSANFAREDEYDPLCHWFASSSAAAFRSIEVSIQGLLFDAEMYIPMSQRLNLSDMSHICAFFYTALFRVVRQLLAAFRCSNPTWSKSPDDRKNRLRPSADVVIQLFEKITRDIVETIEDPGLPIVSTDRNTSLHLASSEAIPDESASIDFVLASPPYCTRIDYAVATACELAVLGFTLEQFSDLRRNLIGTTTVEPNIPTQRFEWGAACSMLLHDVFSHPSRASSSYYYKNHVQYFHSMFKSVRELGRVLKDSGLCVLVVQDSFYKNIHNDLPTIIAEMAEINGMTMVRKEVFRIRAGMAAINPEVKKYRDTFNAAEAVLCFQK